MRIYTSQNDPLDFCNRCADHLDETEARVRFAYLGDGPDGRGDCFAYDAEHPDYMDDDYQCEDCGSYLTDADNYWGDVRVSR
jgi:hypothetical protein